MATKRRGTSSGIGGSLILIIFIVLTITIFSVLTLVSSQNELGMVNKSAKITQEYYTAEKAAAEKCGELEKALTGLSDNQEIVSAAISMDAFASAAENGVVITFSVDIDEHRALETSLNLKDGELETISKNIVSKGSNLIIEDTMDIWDGSLPML